MPAAESVATAWVQRYNGHAESEDYAGAIVVDSSGNVIVAGTTDAGFTGGDWLIIKYSGAGVPLWINRYNGGSDLPHAVTVDRGGNVFVTGQSDGAFTTIGYSSAGVPLWTNRIYGGGANAMALDTRRVRDGIGQQRQRQ